MEVPSEQQTESSTSAPHDNTTANNAVDKAVYFTNTVVTIVKEVSEVLQHVPYMKALSGVILQFIKIKEELKLNKERCHEIIDKVLHLSHWIYEKLAAIAKSGEREKENLAQIESSLNLCASTLKNVLDKLKKHQARNKLTKLISRGLDDLNKLDRSVDNLEKRLVRDIIFDIKLQQGIATGSAVTDTEPNGHDHVLPPRPHLIVERDSQLNASLEILLGADTSRIAIIGGGGFGKTTLARTILHDPKITERYKSRYFLSCEGMTNAETLLLGFGAMLRITALPPDILASARRLLQTSTTILCLDNLETPWEPSATRTKVEDLLASIADIPNLSLIVTMRGMQRPSKVPWSQPLLAPLSTLSTESARVILQEICPDHTIDECTKKLLDSIEGIPLAITLISNLLRDGETSQALWTRWPKEETSMVENGGDDRESSLDKSIELSVNSPRTRKDPSAITLLAALSLFPDGFPLAETQRLEEYLGIHGIYKLLHTLRSVALIKPDEANPSPRIQMLSPIRLFCNQFLSSEISTVLEKVISYYTNVMLNAEYEESNMVIYAQIVPEIQNIHSVFRRGYTASSSQEITQLIDATVVLTEWSEYIGYSTQDTIQMALKRSTDFPISHAKCLHALGELYFTEGNHSKAKACFTEAADLFDQGNDLVQRAWSLERLGDVLQSLRQLDEAEDTLKASLELYIQTDKQLGQANVGYSLGKLYLDKAQYSEAEESLMAALEAYKQMQGLLGQSNAAQNLTRLHSDLGHLAKAEELATEALDAAKRANYALGEGNANGWLGNVYRCTDRVEEARQTLDKALSIHKQQNDPMAQLIDIDYLGQVQIQLDQLSAAEALLILTASVNADLDVIEIPQILTILGWLYICGDRLDKAEQHLDNALKLFRKFGGKKHQATALSHLGTVCLRSNRLHDAEEVLKSIPDLGEWEDVEIRRHWVLGDLYIVKGQLDDAETAFNSAMARCQKKEFSYSFEQGNIIRSIGTLDVKRGHIDQAIEKFKEACEFHRKAQWVSEQATDLKRLGEAYEMLGRSEEAEAALKEAEALMESVRESRVLADL